jgi:hypothetical protein
VREKFPLEMAEIQGAVIAADINDDGKIELVTADTHGNVAAWSTKGEEIWETHLKSLVPQVSFSVIFFSKLSCVKCTRITLIINDKWYCNF